MPPNVNSRPVPYQACNGYPTPPEAEPQTQLRRVDSRLEFRVKPTFIMEAGDPNSSPEQTRATAQIPPTTTQRERPASKPPQKLLFSITNNPTEKVKKEDLQKIRQHVMHDYIDKGATSHKRRRTEVSSDPEQSPSAQEPASKIRRDSSQGISASTTVTSSESITPRRSPPSLTPDQGSRQSRSVPVDNRAVASRNAPSMQPGFGPYSRTEWFQVPFYLERLGGHLNPFDTWPSFHQHGVNVNELKYNCTHRFNGVGTARYWVPILLQARHAFLSTICISTAHDEIMKHALTPMQPSAQRETRIKLAVKDEVLRMIGESVKDPALCVADSTIVAILHCLNSEIMGDDEAYLNAHVTGLNAIVGQRGGLSEIGGQPPGGMNILASVLTITMLLLAALRERNIDERYLSFARSKNQQPKAPPNNTRAESPLACRKHNAYRPMSTVNPHSKILKMLDQVRTLLNGTMGEKKISRDEQLEIYTALEQSEVGDRRKRASLEERRYDAIRLASVLFAKALVDNVPLSEASKRLRAKSFGRTRNQPHDVAVPPIHVQIRDALLNTQIEECWNENNYQMSGVLFWITLVSAASAGLTAPVPAGTADDRANHEARKWLTAIAVRCSIRLSFEQPLIIMGALRRLVSVQRTLDARFRGVAPLWPVVAAPPPPPPRIQDSGTAAFLPPTTGGVSSQQQPEQGTAVQGPAETFTMRDFALEFESCAPDPAFEGWRP